MNQPGFSREMEPIGGRFQPESESLRIRGASDVNPSPRVGSEMSQLIQGCRKRKKTFFPPPFVSIQAPKGLDEAHLHWGGQSTKSMDPNANFPESVFNLGTCGPLMLINHHIHHLTWFFISCISPSFFSLTQNGHLSSRLRYSYLPTIF